MGLVCYVILLSSTGDLLPWITNWWPTNFLADQQICDQWILWSLNMWSIFMWPIQITYVLCLSGNMWSTRIFMYVDFHFFSRSFQNLCDHCGHINLWSIFRSHITYYSDHIIKKLHFKWKIKFTTIKNIFI